MGRPMGRGERPMCTRAQSNWGVLTAGNSTMLIRMPEPSCMSSVRRESVKPRIACFAPQ